MFRIFWKNEVMQAYLNVERAGKSLEQNVLSEGSRFMCWAKKKSSKAARGSLPWLRKSKTKKHVLNIWGRYKNSLFSNLLGSI